MLFEGNGDKSFYYPVQMHYLVLFFIFLYHFQNVALGESRIESPSKLTL